MFSEKIIFKVKKNQKKWHSSTLLCGVFAEEPSKCPKNAK
jgi:hypothetical protein